MAPLSILLIASLTALSQAIPAPQVPGYTDADFPISQSEPTGPLATSFFPDSQVPAIHTLAPSGNETGAAPTPVGQNFTGPTSHGPFNGTATVTGAVNASSTVATAISPGPPNPTATYYNADGQLQEPAALPFMPAGGLGTNGTEPRYMVESDFDFESLALALYVEYIELDLFNNGLAVLSEQDFISAGLTAEDRSLIAYMSLQEIGHATVIANMLGAAAPKQCTYDYPFTNAREFVDFNQKLTQFAEAGVWGFINHLDSREAAQLLSQSIAVESRQQMAFRQMSGLHPMPVWHETGIPQSWAWTYLAPYISSCPGNATRLAWQNFPALRILNQPNINRFSPNDTRIDGSEIRGNRSTDPGIATLPRNESCINLNVTGYGCGPAIARNRSEPLSFPGKQVFFSWDDPGQAVGPNNSYVTSTTAGDPKWVAWVSQLNLTYTELNVTGPNEGTTYQPADEVFVGDPQVNGTMFIALTDENPFLSPFNLSFINPHVRALGLYQAG